MDKPFHSPLSLTTGWYACDHPERPHDGDCFYLKGCRSCTIKMRADRGRLSHLRDSDTGEWITYEEALSRMQNAVETREAAWQLT